MKRKRKAVPVVNDRNGNPMSSAHSKGNESPRINQTPGGPVIVDYVRPLVLVATERSDALPGPFESLHVDVERGRLIMSRPAAEDLTDIEFRRFQIPPHCMTVPGAWICSAEHLIERYGIKRVYVDAPLSREFITCCYEKGVEIWMP